MTIYFPHLNRKIIFKNLLYIYKSCLKFNSIKILLTYSNAFISRLIDRPITVVTVSSTSSFQTTIDQH